MKKNEISKRIEDGGILFGAILEVVGKPQDHVKKTTDEYIERIRKNSKYEVISVQTQEPIKLEDSESLYSMFCDLEILVKNMSYIYDFCLEYMPASLEIIEPNQLIYPAQDATGILNDFIAKIHQVDMHAKELNQTNSILAKSLSIMIQNAILILLNLSPRTAKDIAKVVGVKDEQITEFLNILEQEEKIKKEGTKYKLNK